MSGGGNGLNTFITYLSADAKNWKFSFARKNKIVTRTQKERRECSFGCPWFSKGKWQSMHDYRSPIKHLQIGCGNASVEQQNA